MNIDRRRLFAALAAGAASAAAATPVLARKRHDDDDEESRPRKSDRRSRNGDRKPQATGDEPNAPLRPTVATNTGIEATSLGLRPNAPEDQSKNFQHAIDVAASSRTPLLLPAGFYRAGGLNLPPYAKIYGVRGASRIVMSGGASLIFASGSDNIGISGLVLDGSDLPLNQHGAVIHFAQARGIRIADCEIVNAGRNGITLEGIEGEPAPPSPLPTSPSSRSTPAD
jgi:hypothetical protein